MKRLINELTSNPRLYAVVCALVLLAVVGAALAKPQPRLWIVQHEEGGGDCHGPPSSTGYTIIIITDGNPYGWVDETCEWVDMTDDEFS